MSPSQPFPESIDASPAWPASATSPPPRWSTNLRARLSRRPTLGLETVTLLASLYFTVFCNAAFWHTYAGIPGAQGAHGPRMALSLAVAMTGLHMVLLCLVLTRWTAKALLTGLLLVTTVAAHYMDQYRVYLDMDMIRNVLHSEAKESGEFLAPALLLPALLYAAVPIALLWWIRIRQRPPARALLVRLATMACALLLSAGALLLSFQDLASLMRGQQELRYLITPGNYLSSLVRVGLDSTKAAHLPRLPVGADARRVVSAGRKPRLLVIVVGETVRAQNWGLNGYSRQTTPQLAALPVLNFPDVSACGSSTEVSLPCMFSARGRRDYDRQAIERSESLLHVLNHAGIAIRWRDNQTGCKGVCRGLPFESTLHAKDPRYCNGQRCFDEILLRGIAVPTPASGDDEVLVLHQLGNHGPSYYLRYPDAYRRYTPTCETPELGQCSRAEVINAYDNAIRYTDHVLALAIRKLQARTDRDTALIYLSDHGESLGESHLYLHGVPYAIAPDVQLKVPLVVWLSPGWQSAQGLDPRCLQQRASEPASHDKLFSTVLGLMQVRTAAYDRGQDLFAGCGRAPGTVIASS